MKLSLIFILCIVMLSSLGCSNINEEVASNSTSVNKTDNTQKVLNETKIQTEDLTLIAYEEAPEHLLANTTLKIN